MTGSDTGTGTAGTGAAGTAGTARTVRVVVADDQPLVRAGLTTMLGTEPGISVVGQAGDGATAVELARALRPDVVCMDIRMPGTDGITATRALCGPDVEDPVPVLILTTFDVDEYLFGALEAGASGFLLKDAEPETLIDAVRSVAAGQGMLANALTKRVLREVVTRRRTQPVTAARATELLTPRELDILLLLAQGMSNEEIAGALVLEVSTIKSHLARAMPKLGVRSRLQAVVWAYQNGIVELGG
jgi:DNA-binding NarL/FixJ family response regulator